MDEIIDFIIKYSYHTDREKIKEVIEKHLEYGTCDFALDKDGEIIFMCRWNVNKNTAEVLDLIIAPKYRNRRKIFKWIIARNWGKFPWVRFLKFKRETKYPERKPKIYSIEEIMGGHRRTEVNV